jgi:hypothetical protein
MRRPLPILGVAAALSGMGFVVVAVVSVFSNHLDMQKHGIAFTQRFHVGFLDGGAWFYSHNWPYAGSTIHISDGDRVTYDRSVGHRAKPDLSWRVGEYGTTREVYVGDVRELVGRDTASDFPGIYYRRFHWVGHQPLWTLRVSLWYALLLLAGLPALWTSRWLHSKNNERTAVDAGRTSLLAFLHQRPSATHRERYPVYHVILFTTL